MTTDFHEAPPKRSDEQLELHDAGMSPAITIRDVPSSTRDAFAPAALAHADRLELRVQTYPYEYLGERVWSLRSVVSTYDAAYVALAEAVAASLAMLDGRLARAPGLAYAVTTSAP